jgi:phosphoribosyl-AMP cyclohydrolase
MPSSGMLRHVDHVRTDVSEECIYSIIRVKRICELGTLKQLTTEARWDTFLLIVGSYDSHTA